MTLHWWMHWFWVTLLTAMLSSAIVQCAPQSEEMQHLSTDFDPVTKYTSREGRASYFSKSPPAPTTTTARSVSITPTNSPKASTNETAERIEATQPRNQSVSTNVTKPTSPEELVHPAVEWTPVNASRSEEETTSNRSFTETPQYPSNSTENTSLSTPKRRNNLTRHPEIAKELDSSAEGASESRIVTEKPLSLETTYLQTRVPVNVESSRRVNEVGDGGGGGGGMDTGAVAGISFAALVLAALAGSTAFVLYRRRYLNKPQTLNDKCSNPDSSGYLDDSTVRDNSEEMYSLDNDSFLNSLEAMTIQNYWTDTVKHTKL